MKIDIEDLVRSVRSVQALAARIGWPDDPTSVEIADPKLFASCLDTAMQAFHDLRPATQTLVDVDVSSVRKSVQIRIMQNGRCEHHGNVEAPLAPSFERLRKIIEGNGGEFHYWGGNNYIDLEFPHQGTKRDAFPEVGHLPWDERYRHLLQRATWRSLRDIAFRFSNLATSIASRCVDFDMKNVLIPSVGLCVDPWLFANCGLSVTATESAKSALGAISEPANWPKVFSRAAYDRWDISTCAAFASIPHPDYFAGMPLLEDETVRKKLRDRIGFIHSDWACIPLETGSVDLVFATNAVPRESADERAKVLDEWARVIRPGGIVFIAHHHPPADWNLDQFFLDRGFDETDFLGGSRPAKNVKAGFQIRYSSG